MSRIFPPANSILPLAVRYEFPAEFMQAYNRNRVLYLIEDGRLACGTRDTRLQSHVRVPESGKYSYTLLSPLWLEAKHMPIARLRTERPNSSGTTSAEQATIRVPGFRRLIRSREGIRYCVAMSCKNGCKQHAIQNNFDVRVSSLLAIGTKGIIRRWR
jgi:hypothetical protein